MFRVIVKALGLDYYEQAQCNKPKSRKFAKHCMHDWRDLLSSRSLWCSVTQSAQSSQVCVHTMVCVCSCVPIDVQLVDGREKKKRRKRRIRREKEENEEKKKRSKRTC